MMFNAKDFVRTTEGLVFAVVSDVIEEGRILCFLRYVRQRQQWRKIQTAAANRLLNQQFPHYLFHSGKLDAALHAVPVTQIVEHYRPRQRLAELMAGLGGDQVEKDCRQLCSLLQQQGVVLANTGVTGSLLPAFHAVASDIDLVFYGRETFHQARNAMKRLIEQEICRTLAEQDWLESYQRRDCDLSLQEYVWHEQRKFNKAMFNGRKVDLNMVVDSRPTHDGDYSKLGKITIQTRVTDDNLAFDYPAEFAIDHDEIACVICFTATYTGQAQMGERIEVSGQVEQEMDGRKRIVVGSNREARGEYIKVLHEN